MSESTFAQWYTQTFDNVPGSDDVENREMIKTIWNAALQHAAQQFEHDLFVEYPGNQVADKLRAMQEPKENHGTDHL